MNLQTHISVYVLWSPTQEGLKLVAKYFLKEHVNFHTSAFSRDIQQIEKIGAL